MFARFYFLIAYTTSIIFYLLLDHVIRSFTINLHLAFDLGFAHHRCQVSVQHCVWLLVMTLGEIQTRLGAADRLTASLPTLMQAHLPRHESAAAAGSDGGRRSVLQLLVMLQIII